jgi:uncharacterized protein YndB with AHSA1/START domain
MDGTLREADGEFRLRFERRLACSLETAWDALTTPATLALWLAEAAIDPVIGGRITLRFANTGIINRGEITEIDRPHLLAHSWSSQGATKARLCWELARDPAGSRLVLTHALSERDHVAMIAAGWHAHLDMLDLALAHLPAPWSWRRWEDLRAAYAAALGG